MLLLSAWVSFLFGLAEEGKHIGSDFSHQPFGLLHISESVSSVRTLRTAASFCFCAHMSYMCQCVPCMCACFSSSSSFAWEKEKLVDPPYPPLHLLAFSSSSSSLLPRSLDTHLYPSHCLRSNRAEASHKPNSWCNMTQ